MGEGQEVVDYVGMLLYAMLFMATVATFVWSCLRANTCFVVSVQSVFHCFLLSFVCVRWAWLGIRSFQDEEDPVTFILNRMAFCLYFTSFLLVLFYWMETYHRNYIDMEGVGAFLPRLRWVFVVTVVAIYLFQLAIMILYLASGEEREGNPIYDANIIADASLFLVYAILFLLYGLRILCERKVQATQLWGDMKDVWKMLAVTLIFTTCFSCRVIMFLVRPLTGAYLDYSVFTVFAYYVPELIPSALQVFIVTTSKEKAIRDNQFIEDLYAEDSSEEEASDVESEEPPVSPGSQVYAHVGPGEVLSTESTALLHFTKTRTSLY